MSFDEEWARVKESAGSAGSTGKGLGAGYRPGLVVHRDDLGKVGNAAFTLHSRLRKGADSGNSCERAASALVRGNLGMGDELRTTLRLWDSQVRTLLQACARISDHLDFSRKAHARDEADIGDAMRRAGRRTPPTSKIYDYLGGA
ncbi:hypothetical protein [Streptomyces sp. NPDC048172]|uniref:hypothetical protein n=1 Tax=Streptomyces sp. NPDC048172 TaxID=3365505 RepID=UPI003711CF94